MCLRGIILILLVVFSIASADLYRAEHFVSCGGQSPSNSSIIVRCDNVRKTLRARLKILSKYARPFDYKDGSTCNRNKYVVITEAQFGNSGNQMVELSNALWFSKKVNGTLVIPNWMTGTLKHFNLTLLNEYYCFDFNDPASGVERIEITSEEAFFMHMLFDRNETKVLLPPWNENTVIDVTKVFINVFAALWSSPSPYIIEASAWLIENKLQKNFRYTAIHKRSLDGGCNKIMIHLLHGYYFSPLDIPLDSAFWGNWKVHPICEMTLAFTGKIMELHGRNSSSIFVAFDGRGDISDYISKGAVFSNAIGEQFEQFRSILDHKYIDMFVAMHSEFFILNPRSTFSFQIYLVRAILGLESTPSMSQYDVYVKIYSDKEVMSCSMERSEANKNALWVSWHSIIQAIDQM